MMDCFLRCLSLSPDDNLYVVLPYFNFCKFNNRRRLFVEFVERMKHTPGVRIVVVEGKLDTDAEWDLPLLNDRDGGAFRHFRFSYPHALWIKENLINLGVRNLPDEWKYMAWIDADLTFVNDHWARDAIARMRTSFDVVYLWQTCVNLGQNGEVPPDAKAADRSFGFMSTTSKYPYHQRAKYGFWHPGYAVACTRRAYEQMGGLFDWGILGSGDRHMALSLIGHAEWSAPGNIHPGYVTRLKEYEARCAGLRLGYVPGTIVHHWHGDHVNRRYVQRWDVLTKGGYDAVNDLRRKENGQIYLTDEAAARLGPAIIEYFYGRKEDGDECVAAEPLDIKK